MLDPKLRVDYLWFALACHVLVSLALLLTVYHIQLPPDHQGPGWSGGPAPWNKCPDEPRGSVEQHPLRALAAGRAAGCRGGARGSEAFA